MEKLCFIASSGGHFEEISKLRIIEESYPSILITESCPFKTEFCKKQYYLPQTNRKELFFIIKFIFIFLKAFIILIKEKPECLITTGALIAYPISMIGKRMGCRLIYIESFARVNQASLTGRLLYRHADLFIVQWEDMLKKYPKAVLGGGIF
jgi:beta-1,4-N-acetylglucosaminyltransferase